MNQIKIFFNLYFSNIDGKIARFQYWVFSLIVIYLILLFTAIQINWNINIKPFIIVFDILFMWPTFVITVKRVTDIVGSTEYLISTIMIALFITIMPNWYGVGFWIWFIIGIPPSNYYIVLKKYFLNTIKNKPIPIANNGEHHEQN
jgi:uncharacterized membrane protein YhaH (DUF805 family)